MKFRHSLTVFSSSLVAGLLSAPPAMAQITKKIGAGLNAAAGPAYGNTPTDLTVIIGGVINAALSLLGVVLLVYLLYGGFLWMTAGGDEGKVKKARDLIKNAVIGLIIIVAAYSIASYVLERLTEVTTGGTGQQVQPPAS